MMNHKELKKTNVNELQTTTSTDLQTDVGSTDTSLYKRKRNNIELIEYKIEELCKNFDKLENDIKEINMPLVERINKYKTILSWAARVITVIVSVFITVCGVSFKLYNDGIQTHFNNIEEKIANISKIENELKTDIKEINHKQNALEIKIVENK